LKGLIAIVVVVGMLIAALPGGGRLSFPRRSASLRLSVPVRRCRR